MLVNIHYINTAMSVLMPCSVVAMIRRCLCVGSLHSAKTQASFASSADSRCEHGGGDSLSSSSSSAAAAAAAAAVATLFKHVTPSLQPHPQLHLLEREHHSGQSSGQVSRLLDTRPIHTS